MRAERIHHDCAWACATAMVEIVEGLLREEEKWEVHQAFYSAVKAASECADIQRNREQQRLRPSKN